MTPEEVSKALTMGEEAFERYDYPEAMRHFKNALGFLERQPPSFQRDKLRSKTMLRMVDTLERSGKWLDALMYVETLANIARVTNDLHLEIEAELKGGSILLKRASWREALSRFKRLQMRIEKSGTPEERGECLLGIATGEWRLGNNDEARIIAQRSISLLREAKDERLEGKATILLASILHDRGEFNTAISLFKEAIDILRSVGDTIDLARAYNNLGEVYKAQEEYKLATEQYDFCVDIAQKSKNRRSEVYGLTNASECLARLGKTKESKERLERVQGFLKELEDEYVLANVEFVRGMTAFREGDENEMNRFFSQAISRIEKMETPYDLGVFAFEYARSLHSLGDTTLAGEMLEKAKRAFEKAHAKKYLEKVSAEEMSMSEA